MSCHGPGKGGKGCDKPLAECTYGRAPKKICRACHGRLHQRVTKISKQVDDASSPASTLRQMQQSPTTVLGPSPGARALESSVFDLQAPIQTVLKILGSR